MEVYNKYKLWPGVFSSCSQIQINSEINKKEPITVPLYNNYQKIIALQEIRHWKIVISHSPKSF